MTKKKLKTKLARAIRKETGIAFPASLKIAKVIVKAGGCRGTLETQSTEVGALGLEMWRGPHHEWETSGALHATVEGPRGEVEAVALYHSLR